MVTDPVNLAEELFPEINVPYTTGSGTCDKINLKILFLVPSLVVGFAKPLILILPALYRASNYMYIYIDVTSNTLLAGTSHRHSRWE